MIPTLLTDAAYAEIKQSSKGVYDAFQAYLAASAALEIARNKSPAAYKRAQKAFHAASANYSAVHAAHDAMAKAHRDAAEAAANDKYYAAIARRAASHKI